MNYILYYIFSYIMLLNWVLGPPAPPPMVWGGSGSGPEDHEQRSPPLSSLLEDIITSVGRRSLSGTFEIGLLNQPMIECSCIKNAYK